MNRRWTPRHVLLVDDDASLRRATQNTLEVAGHQVTACVDGCHALDLLRAGVRPQVILLDLMMPAMDGWTFRVEQKADPDIARIPVIALSANPTPQARAIDAVFLHKTTSPVKLLEAIEEVTRRADEQNARVAELARMERLAAMGQLTAKLAHELRNPLTYVSANLEELAQTLPVILEHIKPVLEKLGRREQLVVADADAMLRDARSGLARVQKIMRDMGVFGRVGPQEPFTSIDVRTACEHAVLQLRARIDERARCEVRFDAAPRVLGSETQLVQVVTNLLENALQAVPEGARERNRVRLEARPSPAGGAVIAVSDTGAGIAPEHLPRIFEPFFTTKREGEGTGLGLAICHGIVTAMGGEIRVVSEVGRGTTVEVQLPPAP